MIKEYKKGYIFEETELKDVAEFCNKNQLLMTKEYETKTTGEKEIILYQIVEVPEEDLKNSVRNKRNIYLEKYVDTLVTNILRWNELSEEEKTNISEYRRYLLDYTNNKDWFKSYPKKYEDWKNK